MDNLTHSLVGVLLSRAGFNRYLRHATPLLFFAANAPDCDAISYFIGGGAESYFQYHRGITHSIIATPVIALLPVVFVKLLFWREKIPWVRAWLIAIVGVSSHWLLDYTNPYGIRLFLPFSDAWPALDITSVVDIWIWAGLLFATLWPMLARLVGSEIGAKTGIGRGWAVFGLAFLLCYNSARWFIHQRAVTVQEARVYEGATPRRALAFPSHFNPLLWKGVVETDRFWVVQTVDLSKELDPAQGQVFFKPTESPAIEAARQTPLFREMMGFSRSLLWRVTPAEQVENAVRVEATDLRFMFTAIAIVDSSGMVRSTSFTF